MRRYLTFMGGRVTLDNVKKTFKAQVKALNKTTPSNDVGKNRCVLSFASPSLARCFRRSSFTFAHSLANSRR